MKPKSLSQILTLCLIGGVATLFGCAPPPTNGIITNHSIQEPLEESTPENGDVETPEKQEERIDKNAGKEVIENLPEREMTRKELTELIEKYREKERAREKIENEKKREQSEAPQKKPEPSRGSLWPKPSNRPSPKASPSTKPSAKPATTKPSSTPSVNSSPKPPVKPSPKASTTPSVKPSTKPLPKPPAYPVPQKPIPSIGPKNPPARPVSEDTGVDAEDEILSKSYQGPKEVVHRPRTTSNFSLSETAAQLAMLDKKSYLEKQKDVIESPYPACNFFVITALFEAKVIDEDHIPMYTARAFPKRYFEPKGWEQIDFKTAMDWMREGRSFDIVIQKGPSSGKYHGHIAVPVGLNAKGDPLVAEGVLDQVTNRIRVYSQQEISKYKVYVRYENTLASREIH